jgi:hypothetical protein
MTRIHYNAIFYSSEDGEYVATCREYPYLSYLSKYKIVAWFGIRKLIHDVKKIK